MLTVILSALAALLLVLLVLAATRPAAFRIQRSIRVQAPAERIYPWLVDFQRWLEWSPYEKVDPAMRRTFGGADRGVGSSYAWDSDSKVGAGRMQILEASAPAFLRIELQFLRPFRATHVAEFSLERAADGTQVTWAMIGRNPFFFRLIGLFCNMDAMVGKDFEAGLADLKRIAEA